MMKTKYKYSALTVLSMFALVLFVSCERDLDELELATYPVNGEVFIDGFSSSLEYEAWGDVTAFDVDNEVKYKGTASMKFAVPNEGETGGYAGGSFKTSVPRNLSGFNALTFWIKATQAANIDVLGFGNNSEGSRYQSALYNVPVTSNWRKVIIPVANPSLLKAETGMFFYSEAPENGNGYTFWIDEVQYETLGTIAHPKPMILEGQEQNTLGVIGQKLEIGGNAVSYNMPNGINQKVYITPYYFTYTSSNEAVASVGENGQITLNAIGSSTISAALGETEAAGSISIQVADFSSAPVPNVPAEDVISIFSDAYVNVPVDYYNGYWAEGQTTQSNIFTVGEDNLLNYYDLNWVGIQFSGDNEIDASGMTHLHLDFYLPNPVDPGDMLSIEINSPNAQNTSFSLTTSSSPALVAETWISVDVELTSNNIDNLYQIVFANGGSSLSAFYVDNIYFYKGVINPGNDPDVAATVPTHNPADVISIYSDAYDNLTGTDYPDWGQQTILTTIEINGDSFLKLANFDYQGIQLASSLDVTGMSYLHLDFWSTTSTVFNIYLISTGPVEGSYSLSVPTIGWSSVDIPISSFGAVDLSDVIQLKVDGDGTVFMDNLYFHYNSGGSTGTEPTVAAPAPTHAQADVISLFSEVYADVTVDTWRTDWSVAVLEEVTIAGNAVKKYSALDFVGIETVSSTIDATNMTHFHIDVWSPDFTMFSIKLVDFGADGAFGGGDDVEHQLDFSTPSQGQWISYDIPLSDFANLTTKQHMAQYILVGQPTGATTVFVDNVYFHK